MDAGPAGQTELALSCQKTRRCHLKKHKKDASRLAAMMLIKINPGRLNNRAKNMGDGQLRRPPTIKNTYPQAISHSFIGY